MSMIGPVAGGAAKAAGKAAAKAAPVVKKTVVKAKKSLEKTIDDMEAQLVNARNAWKTATVAERKKIERWATQHKKKLNKFKDELTGKTNTEGQMESKGGYRETKRFIKTDSDTTAGKLIKVERTKGPKMSDKVSAAQARYNDMANQYIKYRKLLQNKKLTPAQRDRYTKWLDKIAVEGKAAKKELDKLIKEANNG